MKKFVFVIISLIFLLTGCSNAEQTCTNGPERQIIGISVGEQGYYTMYADVTLGYYKGELSFIEVNDPTLLSFRASEHWSGGGYYVYSCDDIEAIIEALQEYSDPALQALIDALQSGLLMTEAST